MSKSSATHTPKDADDTAKIEITLQELKEIIRDVVRSEIEHLVEDAVTAIHYPAKSGTLADLPTLEIGQLPEEFNNLSREELYDDRAL